MAEETNNFDFSEEETQADETRATDGGPTALLEIGPYRLLQQIGEGGMGEVWLAEQEKPRRRVALKVIRPGMDTKQVIARFEIERQALALMDHPCIAKVFCALTKCFEKLPVPGLEAALGVVAGGVKSRRGDLATLAGAVWGCCRRICLNSIGMVT